MKRRHVVKSALAATALAGSLLVAGPADAAVSSGFSCSRGVTTQIYSSSGSDYHEVNNRYYYWGAPSNYWTTVNWAATSGYWYLSSNTGFNFRVYCR